MDERILVMSRSEQFNRIVWNGLIGYGSTVEGWVERAWGITGG